MLFCTICMKWTHIRLVILCLSALFNSRSAGRTFLALLRVTDIWRPARFLRISTLKGCDIGGLHLKLLIVWTFPIALWPEDGKRQYRNVVPFLFLKQGRIILRICLLTSRRSFVLRLEIDRGCLRTHTLVSLCLFCTKLLTSICFEFLNSMFFTH